MMSRRLRLLFPTGGLLALGKESPLAMAEKRAKQNSRATDFLAPKELVAEKPTDAFVIDDRGESAFLSANGPAAANSVVDGQDEKLKELTRSVDAARKGQNKAASIFGKSQREAHGTAKSEREAAFKQARNSLNDYLAAESEETGVPASTELAEVPVSTGVSIVPAGGTPSALLLIKGDAWSPATTHTSSPRGAADWLPDVLAHYVKSVPARLRQGGAAVLDYLRQRVPWLKRLEARALPSTGPVAERATADAVLQREAQVRAATTEEALMTHRARVTPATSELNAVTDILRPDSAAATSDPVEANSVSTKSASDLAAGTSSTKANSVSTESASDLAAGTSNAVSSEGPGVGPASESPATAAAKLKPSPARGAPAPTSSLLPPVGQGASKMKRGAWSTSSRTWTVRGVGYKSSPWREGGPKVESKLPFAETVGVDFFHSGTRSGCEEDSKWYAEKENGLVKQRRASGETGLLVVVHWRFSVPNDGCKHLAFIFAVSDEEATKEKITEEGATLPYFLALLPKVKTQRIKFISSFDASKLQNLSFPQKQSAEKLSAGKPVLIGKQGEVSWNDGWRTEGKNFVEMSQDLSSSPLAALMPNLHNLDLQFAFLFEAAAQSKELPERVLGSGRLLHVDWDQAKLELPVGGERSTETQRF